MRRQIVAACLLQYIFVGEEWLGRTGRKEEDHLLPFPVRTPFGGRSFSALLPPGDFSRDYRSDGREAAAAIRFRVHERRHFHNIQMYKSARDRSRWRMKKVETAPTEEKRFVDTTRTEAYGGKEEERERKRQRGRKKTVGTERKKKGRGRRRARKRRQGKGRNE